jgi:radical SAM protein with 4Fe4S-binding SPASM domain
MVTNGTLLRQNAERLAECGIKTIGVSIDGLEATHDRVRRRPGLFRTIVDGIKHAKSVGIPVAAITAVNNNNIDELPFLREFLGELGIGYWQVQPTFALGRAKQAAHLELSDRTFIALGDFVKRSEAKKAERQLEIVTADGLGYHHPLKTSDRPWKGCHAGLASCGITSEGSIKACLSLPDHLVEGNLRERDLWDIWFDERSFAINRRFVRCNLGENCHSCAHGETCRGGCMVMSIAATGRANNDPYCLYRLHEAIRQSGSQPKPCGLQLSE